MVHVVIISTCYGYCCCVNRSAFRVNVVVDGISFVLRVLPWWFRCSWDCERNGGRQITRATKDEIKERDRGEGDVSPLEWQNYNEVTILELLGVSKFATGYGRILRFVVVFLFEFLHMLSMDETVSTFMVQYDMYPITRRTTRRFGGCC